MKNFKYSKFKKCFLILILLVHCHYAFAAKFDWGPINNLPQTGNVFPYPQLTLSADGTKATAIWQHRSGSRYQIRTASAIINGKTSNWGPVTNLEPTFGYYTEAAHIALSADGTKATAVWEFNDGITTTIRSASATINGNLASWSAARTISYNRDVSAYPKISLSADGTKAIAVWTFFDFDSTIILSRSATISGNSAIWSTIDELYVSESVNGNKSPAFAQIQLSADGTKATALWFQVVKDMQSRSATLSGNTVNWGPVKDVTAKARRIESPQLALATDGTKATVVWMQDDGFDFISRSRSAVISGNSAYWGAATKLPEAGQNAIGPKIALSEDGTKATAVWYQNNGADSRIVSRSALISGNSARWGSPEYLSDPGSNSYNPHIKLSANGTIASVVWTQLSSDFSNSIVRNISGIISGNIATWGSKTDLSEAGRVIYSAVIAMSADGTKATALWMHRGGSDIKVQSRSAILVVDIMPVLDLLLFQ